LRAPISPADPVSQRVMPNKIVLQSRERLAYLLENGEWTARAEEALQFRTAREAEEHCRAKVLKEADIVVLRPNQPPLRIRISMTL